MGPARSHSRWRRRALWAAGVLLAGFLLIQLVPYGRDHSNPPVTGEPRWDSPRTAQFVRQSCGDCHGNRTTWPWYSNVAPMSWLVQKDVDEGRGVLNFSEWDRPQPGVGDLVDQVLSGEMPPTKYTILHSGAALSDAQKRALARGLERTYAQSPPAGIRSGGG